MRLFFSLTKARNKHEGITRMMIEIYNRKPSNLQIYGDAFLCIFDKKKDVKKYYDDTFPGIELKTKRMLLPMRFIYKILNNCKKNIFFKDKKKDDDIKVFFHNFIPNNRCKAKKILVIHDLTPVYDTTMSEKDRKKHLNQYIYSANIADLIFTDSYYSKEDIIKNCNVPAEKIIVNYCGVDKNYYEKEYSSEELQALKKKYNLPEKYILFIGQPRKNKNLLNLIEGYSLLDSKIRKEFGLVLSRSTDDLKKKVEELKLDNVIFLNGIAEEDIVPCYKGASLVSLISTSEGFGLPLVEAMCCGIPTITSNVSCLPEVSGGASILVDPYDVKSIADGLKEGLTNNDLRSQLIEKGYKRIDAFNWENTAKIFYDGVEGLSNGK